MTPEPFLQAFQALDRTLTFGSECVFHEQTHWNMQSLPESVLHCEPPPW